jgi:hypothetical protein
MRISSLLILSANLVSSAAINRFFETDDMTHYIFTFIPTYVQAREVSKTFHRVFDKTCRVILSKVDERLKKFVEMEAVLASLPENADNLSIPLQVPLCRILFDHIGFKTLLLYKNMLNLEYPVLVVPVRRHRRRKKIWNRSLKVETDRILELVHIFIEINAYNPQISFESAFSPRKLFDFYRLIRVIFARLSFTKDLIPSLHFPIRELLNYAIIGSYEDSVFVELFREFHSFATPEIIFDAFKANRLDNIKFVLSLPHAERFMQVRDVHNHRALHYAAHFGDVELIDKCLNLGADPKKVDSKNERAIHKAAAKGHLDAVRLLYQRNSPINSMSECKSPIFLAVRHQHVHIVSFILNETDLMSYMEDFNMKLLTQAVEHNNHELVVMLLGASNLVFQTEQVHQFMQKCISKGSTSADIIQALQNYISII